MKKAYNFNAGPCVLPKPAIEAAIEALKDFKGTGMSVIEVSHRSKEWEAVMNECRALWKELLPGDRRMGKEGPERGQGYRQRIRSGFLSRQELHLHPQGL